MRIRRAVTGAAALLGSAVLALLLWDSSGDKGSGPQAEPTTEAASVQGESGPSAADGEAAVAETATAAASEKEAAQADGTALAERYRHLGLIDVHNHDAVKVLQSMRIWERYRLGKVVLFGNVSEPTAMLTDRMAWAAYRRYPDIVYPFFSGFDMHEAAGLETVRANLEQGYLGIGETVAASTRSPVVSKVAWKAEHPMDANLPAVYELAAEYDAPVLLHIDPPIGTPIAKLKEALDAYPDTTFIFAHANVFNPSSEIEALLAAHPNLMIDFFPGFSSYNQASPYETSAYIDLIERYPDRFFLSTDSGFDLTYDEALSAMYETIDLLKPETQEKVARTNFQQLIDRQRPTDTQWTRFEELGGTMDDAGRAQVSRHELNAMIFELDN